MQHRVRLEHGLGVDPPPRKRLTGKARFVAAFVSRTTLLRKSVGMTQQQVADALGVKQDHYKTFETRTALPHHLVKRFCQAVGCRPDDLFLPIDL